MLGRSSSVATNLSVFANIPASNSRCTSARFRQPTPSAVLRNVSATIGPRSAISRQSHPCAWRQRVALRHVRSGSDNYVCFRKEEPRRRRKEEESQISRLATAKCAGNVDNASPERHPVRYVRSTRLESFTTTCDDAPLGHFPSRISLVLSTRKRKRLPSAVIYHVISDSDAMIRGNVCNAYFFRQTN